MRYLPLFLLASGSVTAEPPADDAEPPPIAPHGAGAVRTAGCSATAPRSVPVTVAALPDSGEAPFVEALLGATKSIHVMVYDMGYGGILDAIVAKAKAGIEVKVILDGVSQKAVNDKYKTLLEAAGAEVHWSDPQFDYMHAKVLIVDDQRAVVSTANYGKSFLLKERNFAADDRDPQDVADLAALFDADWSTRAPELSCTRLVVSPINSKARIVALIDSAQKSVLVESMELSDFKVRGALVARRAAGVDVRVLLASPSWIGANTKAAAYMKSKNVATRWLDAPTIHVKAIVVDGERAYLGSENLSPTSLTKNREIGLVVTDAPAVATMSATMEADYAKATTF